VDSSEFKKVYYPRNSIGINRRGYSGCSGLEKRRLPQLRKINCSLQDALAEKAAWWAARCYAGLASKSLDFKPFLLIAPLSAF